MSHTAEKRFPMPGTQMVHTSSSPTGWTFLTHPRGELKGLPIPGELQCRTRSSKTCPTVQFSSVAQSCPTLCDPMNCSMPGLPVHHSRSLPKLMFIKLVMPSSHLILCHPAFSSFLQSFPASGSFPMSHFFTSGGQSIGVPASASVLPMNIQD